MIELDLEKRKIPFELFQNFPNLPIFYYVRLSLKRYYPKVLMKLLPFFPFSHS